ncbi:ANTAR domain-containing protein [Streptomyces sp. ODS28]|uniref:ANTAR domain-containing protein n=1 Tax=Streptomyces sp. ODS28 TaxID=3136688 RepID=UPI0031E5687F
MVSADLAAVLNELTARPGLPLSPEAVRRTCSALGVDGAAVTLAHSGPPPGELLWASGETAERLEELQFTLGVGPGVDTVASGALVLEPELREVPADRWPGFPSAAEQLGVRAVFGLPLRIGAIRTGVLLLCRATPGRLSDDALAQAQVLASALTLALLGIPREGAHPVAGGRLADVDWVAERAALRRAEVHQATGMVSVQLGVGPELALLRLRVHAYARGLPLLEVARDVVARKLRLTDDEDGERGST